MRVSPCVIVGVICGSWKVERGTGWRVTNASSIPSLLSREICPSPGRSTLMQSVMGCATNRRMPTETIKAIRFIFQKATVKTSPEGVE